MFSEVTKVEKSLNVTIKFRISSFSNKAFDTALFIQCAMYGSPTIGVPLAKFCICFTAFRIFGPLSVAITATFSQEIWPAYYQDRVV